MSYPLSCCRYGKHLISPSASRSLNTRSIQDEPLPMPPGPENIYEELKPIKTVGGSAIILALVLKDVLLFDFCSFRDSSIWKPTIC